MRIYFSGGRGLKTTPERLIAHMKPDIMLTYLDIDSNGVVSRLNVFLKRKTGQVFVKKKKQRKNARKRRRRNEHQS